MRLCWERLMGTDMINIFKFDYTPNACAWVHTPGAGQTLFAVSDLNSPTIRIYDGRGDGKPLNELTKIHRAPVHLMAVSWHLTFNWIGSMGEGANG